MKKFLAKFLAAGLACCTVLTPCTNVLAADQPSLSPNSEQAASDTVSTLQLPSPSSVTSDEASLVQASSAVPMYRLYNKNSGEHFYTASGPERDNCIKSGWSYEGIGWYAPASSNTPVYRLYNKNGGEHHYTTNPGERSLLLKRGWSDEKVGWYSDPGMAVPLYRQYNPHAFANNHNYTTSKSENDGLVRLGWKAEGIGWYGVETPKVTFENDTAYAEIEANLKLTGSGTGYHGKVVISGGGSLASFGIQYFQNMHWNKSVAAQAGKTDTVFLLENIMSHAAEAGLNGKHYAYIANSSTGKNYKIRLSWSMSDNMLHCYVNDVEIHSEKTTISGPLQFAIEGSCAHNGDTIHAEFTNVRVACGDGKHNYRRDHLGSDYGTIGVWNDKHNNYFGLKATVVDPGQEINEPGRTQTFYSANGTSIAASYPAYNASINIDGTAQIASGYDWDTSFQIRDPFSGRTGVPLSAQAVIAQQQVG